MRKALVCIVIFFLLSIPTLAFPQEEPDPHAWTGNMNLFWGTKFLEKDDWEPVDKHVEGGVLIDFRQNRWPISIAVDILYSEDDKDVGVTTLGFGTFSANVKAQTRELNIGIRKIWEGLKYARPFIGGGVAVINAELTSKALGSYVSDDDTAFGLWIDTGIYVTLTRNINVGIDARWSRAEVELLDVKGKAGGLHVGAILGYHW